MYAMTTAAEHLGVTPKALSTALERGETIASLTRACGLDPDEMTLAVINAEVADIEALAMIAGFDASTTATFVAELREYLITYVWDGQAAADARFDGAYWSRRELVAA